MANASEKHNPESQQQDDLSVQVILGSSWEFANRAGYHIITLLKVLILARLLAPEDFGLFGIILLVMEGLRAFSHTGFKRALIQQKEDIQPYLNTAWTIELLRGLVLGALLFLCAPLIAAFFAEARAVPLMRVMAISVVLRGTRNIGIVYFRKELEIRKRFLYRTGSNIVGLIVSVIIAYEFRSVWALVWGAVSKMGTRMVLSYGLHPYRPWPELSRKAASEMFSFGRWVLGSSMLRFLLRFGDDAVVGRILGSASLGFYQMAWRIANLPATQIGHVVQTVTFPAYSKLQDDMERLRKYVLHTVHLSSVIVFPMSVGLFLVAPEAVALVLGNKWLPMVPALQVLTIFGAIRALAFGPVFHATGNPQIVTKVFCVKVLLRLSIIIPLAYVTGLFGVSLGVLGSCILVQIGSAILALRLTGISTKTFAQVLRPAVFATMIMTAGVELISYLFRSTQLGGVPALALMVCTGFILYCSAAWLQDREFLREILARTYNVLWKGGKLKGESTPAS